MADVTLQQGVATGTGWVAPGITKVLDVRTDHAGGTNPYYQPGKQGGIILRVRRIALA